MIGDGGEKEKLSSMIGSFGLNNSVKLLGVQDNPYKYFKVSDLFVSTSLSEGFGLAMIEAMACGLPVLAASFDGVKSILGDSDYELICENSEDGIYHMMKSVLDHQSMLNDYRKHCLRQAEQFDISRQVELIQQLFTEEAGYE